MSYITRDASLNRRDTSVLNLEITDSFFVQHRTTKMYQSRLVKAQRRNVFRDVNQYMQHTKQSILCYCSLPAASPGKLGYCAIKHEGLLDYIDVECDLSADFS